MHYKMKLSVVFVFHVVLEQFAESMVTIWTTCSVFVSRCAQLQINAGTQSVFASAWSQMPITFERLTDATSTQAWESIDWIRHVRVETGAVNFKKDNSVKRSQCDVANYPLIVIKISLIFVVIFRLLSNPYRLVVSSFTSCSWIIWWRTIRARQYPLTTRISLSIRKCMPNCEKIHDNIPVLWAERWLWSRVLWHV